MIFDFAFGCGFVALRASAHLCVLCGEVLVLATSATEMLFNLAWFSDFLRYVFGLYLPALIELYRTPHPMEIP
jgi:hypothetical protein